MFIGACKMYSHNIGALPVGLKGKLYGQPFKVLVQYDAFGGVRTQIFEDEEQGGLITEIKGDRSEKKSKGEAFANWAYSRYAKQNSDKFPFKDADSYSIRERDSIKRDIDKRGVAIISNLVDETIDFNKGKDTKVVKGKTINIPAKKVSKPKVVSKPKFKEIRVSSYNVPGYTVKAHTRRIMLK
jgi:hypothetical protein